MTTTARILVNRALDKACGQDCVDWAISLLQQGRDGHFLTRLAGMLPPLNHFEIASLRDQTLEEQRLPIIDNADSLRIFAAVAWQLESASGAALIEIIEALKALCWNRFEGDELLAMRLLFWAYSDLKLSEVQWYWKGATRSNIVELICNHATQLGREIDRRQPEV